MLANKRRQGMIKDLEAMAARAYQHRSHSFAAECDEFRDELVVAERCRDLLAVGFKCGAGGSSFRCGICGRMQPGSAVCVMVPEYMETKGLTRDLLIRELALDDDCYGCCEDCARNILNAC